MNVKYRLYHNQDAHFIRGYQEGDLLQPGYEGEIEFDPEPEGKASEFYEAIFMKHNRDDRPDGQTAPSLSIGDLICLSEVWVTVQRFGFGFISAHTLLTTDMEGR